MKLFLRYDNLYLLFYLRVPITVEQHLPSQGFFRAGFALNIGRLLWSICGGFIIYFITCNFLTQLLKPSFEPPVRTISDVLERDMGLIFYTGMDTYIVGMRESNVGYYNKVNQSNDQYSTFFHSFLSSWLKRLLLIPTGTSWRRKSRKVKSPR